MLSSTRFLSATQHLIQKMSCTFGDDMIVLTKIGFPSVTGLSSAQPEGMIVDFTVISIMCS